MNQASISRQLEELQLIQCSLLPDELFILLDNEELWSRLLADYSTGLYPADAPGLTELAPARFQVKLQNSHMWFEIEILDSSSYASQEATSSLSISVKGEGISRAEQQRWQDLLHQKLLEISDAEFPAYELVSLYLLPLLHEESEKNSAELSSTELPENANPRDDQLYHALLTSHHLISPHKRRSLQQWSSSLSISGFAKVGYPGVIYAQGSKGNIEEFVSNVKAMQWLALRVRFVEPLEGDVSASSGNQRRWNEYQKVGEVVEEMRRLGREEYVVEMGIGSAGTNK